MGGAEGMGGSFGHGAFWGRGGGDLDGGEQTRTALVHGRKTGVLLRGTALLRWIEEGQQNWIYERVTAVSVGGVRMVAVY